MPAVVEIWNEFTKGKKTRRGRPLAARPEPVVTLVAPDAIDAFLGARTRDERVAHLRRLRDDGVLLHDRGGRLTQTVRGHAFRRAYVFRCREREVPRIDPGARALSPEPTGGGLGEVFTV